MDGTLRLIDRIYDTVLDIEGYDRLWDLWQQHLMPGEELGSRLADEEVITEQFRRAHVLLGRLAESRGRHGPGLGEALLASQRCELLVSGDGRILATSPPASGLLGVDAGSHFSDLPLEAGMGQKVMRMLGGLQRQDDDALLAVFSVYPQESTTPLNLTLRRVTDELGTAVGLVGEAALPDTAPMAMALARGFGLTAAETGIVAELLRGESPARIAAHRTSSSATVRTQIKSILRKTGLHSQVELMSLALAASRPSTLADGVRPSAATGPNLLERSDGRRLAWQEFGDPKGRPVLFLHGMLDGWSLPDTLAPHLKAAGLRLIAPARPGYGATSPATGIGSEAPAENTLEAMLCDLRALLASLGIGPVLLVGQGIGMIHAQAFAARDPLNVTGMVACAGVVPDLAANGLTEMAPRQKVLLTTLPRREQVGRMLLRLAVSLIAHRGHRRFADSLYRTSPGDLALSRDATSFARLCAGYEMMSIQGENAAVHDTQLLAGDWAGRVASPDLPLDLFHGIEDPATPIGAVRAYAAMRGGTRLVEMPGCGQLVGHAAPEQLCELLAARA